MVKGFNGKAFLQSCLAPALDRTYPAGRYEVILADNASMDAPGMWVARSLPARRECSFLTGIPRCDIVQPEA